jgi:putative proteasome-type protease
MTYCVGILVRDGLVLAADSRTNAGVDHIATVRKLALFERPGERVMVLLSAGNLATTQAVVTLLTQRLEEEPGPPNLLAARTMFDAARMVGGVLREVMEHDGEHMGAHGDPSATFLFGGQLNGDRHRLFLIYPAGNFIEATPETPFLQAGETKYGKPILDRVISYEFTLAAAAKCALLSFDATMRSNLSVAPPIDLLCYPADSLRAEVRNSIADDDAYFAKLRAGYGQGNPGAVQAPARSRLDRTERSMMHRCHPVLRPRSPCRRGYCTILRIVSQHRCKVPGGLVEVIADPVGELLLPVSGTSASVMGVPIFHAFVTALGVFGERVSLRETGELVVVHRDSEVAKQVTQESDFVFGQILVSKDAHGRIRPPVLKPGALTVEELPFRQRIDQEDHAVLEIGGIEPLAQPGNRVDQVVREARRIVPRDHGVPRIANDIEGLEASRLGDRRIGVVARI